MTFLHDGPRPIPPCPPGQQEVLSRRYRSALLELANDYRRQGLATSGLLAALRANLAVEEALHRQRDRTLDGQ